mgnify:CR=1 FL=1
MKQLTTTGLSRFPLLAVALSLICVPALADQTNIRVIHLSPDAPPVDVLVNGTLRPVTNLAFPDSTSYLTIDAGTYTFDVVPTGADLADSVLNIPNLALAADSFYTAVAYDELSSISPLALTDDFSALPANTNRLRAVHAAVGVGEVDIWLVPDVGAPSLLWENVGFGVAGGYLQVPAAALTVGFDVNDDATPDVLFDVPALPAGTSANVFAVTDGAGDLFLNAQLEDGTTVRIDPAIANPTNIRVIHLSPDAPPVDVLVDGSLRAFESLEFPDSTGYATVEAGTYDFDVVPAGGSLGDSVLSIPSLSLAVDEFYTAVAYDQLVSLSPLALVDDYSGLPADTNRVRAIHTAVGVGEVDIWLVPETGAPSPLWQNVGFGVAGNYLQVPAAPLNIGFDVNDDAVPDVLFGVPALPAGTSANVFAVTDAMGSLFLIAQLPDGATVRLDPILFADGFETGTTNDWSTAVP